MSRTAVVICTILGLSIAAAKKGPKTYEINLREPAAVGTVQLPPGDYRIHLDGGKAVFNAEESHQSMETAVVVHNAATKYDETSITMTKGKDGGDRIEEITLHGTNMKLDFPN
jgi:hypothetical protein